MKKIVLLFILTTSLLLAQEFFFDSDTGLFWQDNKKSQTTKRDWKNAKGYCRELKYLGYTDWRVPSKEELLELYDKESRLKNLSSSRYWSSSEYSVEVSRAWSVGFYDGHASKTGKSNKLYIRCVIDRR